MLAYQGDRRRTLLTRLGDVTVERSYYVGPCEHTVFPTDELLGLGHHGILPELQQLIALQCSRVPYAEAVATLTGLLPIRISPHTAQQVTSHISGQVQAEQEREREEAFGDPACARFPDPEAPVSSPVAVVAADGGMCRTRHSEDTYKEFKMGVLGTLCPAPGSKDKAKVENKRYVAHLGDADTFFEHLTVDFHRAGLQHAQTLQVLGDGAPWLWSRFELLRQENQEYVPLLDFYHASEHLHETSDAIFGPSTVKGKCWYERMRKRLLDGELRLFFREFQVQEKRAIYRGCREAAQAVAKAYGYFQERRRFLGYRQCRMRGLPIGSGMVEGGIRFVGKDRLDRTGMRWSIPGAEDVLQLRCLSAGKRWGPFFQNKARERLNSFQQKKASWLRLRAA
ncbi:MAG: ISKra4 family transposase [Armatimonadetes bacterium]|nr:ISKra4 family transposase [Armatimonadota bacterium]